MPIQMRDVTAFCPYYELSRPTRLTYHHAGASAAAAAATNAAPCTFERGRRRLLYRENVVSCCLL